MCPTLVRILSRMNPVYALLPSLFTIIVTVYYPLIYTQLETDLVI
jgi:hypothetical protein